MLGRNFGSSLTCDCVPLDGEKGKYFCVTVDRFTSHHKLRQLDRMTPSELPCFVSGIVPNFCRELFRCLTDRSSGDRIQYQVYLSMIEIYNETVRDLILAAAVPAQILALNNGIVHVQTRAPSVCLDFASLTKCRTLFR